MTAIQKFKDVILRRPRRISLQEYAAKLIRKGIGPDGQVVADPTPIAPPIGYKKHPSMVELVRDMVRSETLAREAAASGHETFEESEDFDIGDEPEQLRSAWENQFDPTLQELMAAGQEVLARRGAEAPGPGPAPTPPKPPAEGAGEAGGHKQPPADQKPGPAFP